MKQFIKNRESENYKTDKWKTDGSERTVNAFEITHCTGSTSKLVIPNSPLLDHSF